MVYDRDRSKADELVSRGAELATSPAELAARVDIILSCVADAAAVRNVYFGADGVLQGARPGARIVEMSTVAPETSLHLFRTGRERGISVLDVAISGSTPAAEAGSLTLFSGGDREAFDLAAPIFPAIARQWFYMGPSGSGVAMKLVVNALLGVGMQAIAEALALGIQLGLPRDLLFDTLGRTAVVAPAHLGKLATAKQNDYTPQFPLRLMHKDFQLILKAAAQQHLPMPATEAAFRVNSDELAHDDEYERGQIDVADGGDHTLDRPQERARQRVHDRRDGAVGVHPRDDRLHDRHENQNVDPEPHEGDRGEEHDG